MVNSKGGFLIEDDKEVDEDLLAKERERERERAMQNLEPRKPLLSALRVSAEHIDGVLYSDVFGSR